MIQPIEKTRSLALAVLFAAVLGVSSSPAQPLERNLPPPEAPKPVPLPTPAEPGTINDDRALGAPLSRLIILGPTDAALATLPAAGLDTHRVARLDPPGSQAVLTPFLGRPISRKLISQIETAIVKRYRALGYPFVEVSTPEQEIDQGMLQIRVVEFHAGKIAVGGASADEAERIKAQIRLAPGEAINSPRLLEDFDWLSRYPFRSVTPAFSPGSSLGETNLNLAVADVRPIQLSGGYANSGSPLTTWDRYFVGVTVGSQKHGDAVLSAQITGSPDFFGGNSHAAYESAASRFTWTFAPRQQLEVSVNAVESNEAVAPFSVRQQTAEVTLGYRGALSNWVRVPGEVSFGLEAARQMRTTYFGDINVLFGAVNVYQLYGGWTDRWNDRLGHATFDVTVHASPGGLGGSNSSANFLSYTNGRVSSASYAYVGIDYDRVTNLPHGFSITTQVNGQYAGQAIPDLEQMGLGGQGAVRGYVLDEGAFDDAVVMRNELRVPGLTLLGKGNGAVRMAPLSFVDAGYGHNEATGQDARLASFGLGADFQLGAFVSGRLTATYPLISARYIGDGDVRWDARISVSY